MNKFKIIRVLFSLLLTAVLFSSCFSEAAHENSQAVPESSTSDLSQTVSEASEQSTFIPESVYEFLLSEYYVTAVRESYGTVYESVYFFESGTVAGVKLNTAFPTDEAAREYYEHIRKDYPDSLLSDRAVTQFLQGENAGYYGYDPEKLLFMLEKTGYEYTLSFDIDEFLKENSGETSE